MSEWLAHPAFQGGIAPFVAALVAALALRPFNLAGLSVADRKSTRLNSSHRL